MMKYLPNILTIIRLCLIPVYLYLFYNPISQTVPWPLIVFVVASFTDVLDGYLARKYEVVSKFGMVADPFADKMMQLAVLYTLYDAGHLQNWFFWILLFKEGSQILLGIVMVSMKPRIIIPANVFGKATTVLVFVTIILAAFQVPGIIWLQALVTVLAIITFFQYAFAFIQALSNRKNTRKE